jgi:UDPglucose 6-dehydrogenase
MKIAVIGSGYVGLVTAACFADLGNDVIGVDIDEEKVKCLNNSQIPIYEPGLGDLLHRNLREKRIRFTLDIKDAIEKSDIIFLAVPTPEGADHRADLSAVKNVAAKIGRYMNGYKIIIDKSTVPVGTGHMVEDTIKENQSEPIDFDVVSNPEFLKEGSAINDFKNPDRVVIGYRTEKSREIMNELYAPICRTDRNILFTTVESAEIIKYASNAMLATRISFVNMLSHLCEKTGADITEVSKGMGLDRRIGPKFLHAGIGYGGSCFPKDVQALRMTLDDYGIDSTLLKAVDDINDMQKISIIPKIENLLGGEIKGKTIAILGIAFKPKTDDIREAPAIYLIKELEKNCAIIRAFDPEAQCNAEILFPDVTYCETPYETMEGADCLVICTEWDEFRSLDYTKMKDLLRAPNIIDGRNIYNPKNMKEKGFNYLSIGRL